MKILFLGAGKFAIPTLELLAGEEMVSDLLVITQPDRGKGRGRKPAPTPVRETARRLGLEVLTPRDVNRPESLEAISKFAPDYLVLVDFGVRLTPETISRAKRAAINLHPSLLPAYRGPAPLAWVLLKGEPVTGVTTQLIGERIDCGHILLQEPTFIRDHETLPELSCRLSHIGAPLVIRTIREWEAGTIEPRPQNELLASKAPKLKKEDGLIDWNEPAEKIFNRIRGLNPWPGTYTFHHGKRVKILEAEPLAAELFPQPPGSIVIDGDRLTVFCGGNTRLEIKKLQPAGKPVRTAAQFIHGLKKREHDCFSTP